MKFLPQLMVLWTCGLASAAVGFESTWTSHPSLEDSWRWSELDSLNEYTITNAAKGRQGEIWFSHRSGLLRYDGKVVLDYPYEGMQSEAVQDILVGSDGTVYLALSYRIFIWSEGSYTILDHDGLRRNRYVLVEDKEGRILFSSASGVYEVKGQQLHKIETGIELPGSLLVDNHGHLWVFDTHNREIQVFRLLNVAGKLLTQSLYTFPTNPDNLFPPKMFLDTQGRVWVMDPDAEDLCYLYDNYQKEPAIRGLRAASLYLGSVDVAEMPSGEIWFTASRRMGKWKNGELSVYDIEDFPIPSSYPFILALSGDRLLLGGQNLPPQVINLSLERWATYPGLNFQCEDGAGTWWFLSQDRSVVSRSGGLFTVYDSVDGVIDTPNRILAGSDGSIWVSGANGDTAAVSYYLAGRWRSFDFPHVGNTFSHLGAIETLGGLFIFGNGTPENELNAKKGGGVIFQKSGAEYHGVHYPPPTFIQRPANIAERQSDGLWFSSGNLFRGLSTQIEGSEQLGPFSNQWVDQMVVDQDNHAWLACLGVGIYQFDGTSWILHGQEHGLMTKKVTNLLVDPVSGGILALSDLGLFHFDGSQWARWGFHMDFPFRRENHTLFADRQGGVWINFASRSWYLEGEAMVTKGRQFQAIRYTPDAEPPETWATLASSKFPEGSQIEVQLDATDPWDNTHRSGILFSWSLDGQAWSPYFNGTEFVLRGLSGGSHTLRVQARDLDGNVDQTPATVAFRVIPPLWKTPSFILGVLAVFALIAYLAYALFQARVKSALAIEEFKLDFFTNISHELRNPLAVILAPVERLLKEEENPERRTSLKLVQRNARKMQSMVDQLLEFRRMEKGKLAFKPIDGEIVSFIRESVSNLQPLWTSKNQHLDTTLTPPAFLCQFDPNILQKIIDNLVSNAVKFSGSGTLIRIEGKVECKDGHDVLTLAVEDEGIGIPLHEQQHILQPFYRVKEESGAGGTGIGLALVNQLVQLWGGKLTLTSPVPGKEGGSRFGVILPLDPFERVDGAELPEDLEETASDRRPSILLVEDNEDFRYVLKTELGDRYRVMEANNGLRGLELAQEQDPDLIVSDVMMPGMGGFALCERLKSDPETSHIPIILLTAKSSADHRVEGIKAGADAYLPKPLDQQYLEARIENLLETRQELRRKFEKQILVEPTEVTVTPADEKILRKAIQVVEDNMREEEFDVARFSELIGMSQSSLKRKLKAMTGLTPQPFIQKMRMKRAARLLDSSQMRVSDVAAEVGIYDLSYFGKIFRKEFGVAPSKYEGEGSIIDTPPSK
jgi:signal transduction histidine kinase/DNA-binding response OmpR family regulator/streptogramin lyase